MFKTMPKLDQQSSEKKRLMEQTRGSDQYTAMRQMASLMGNQAMLGMMQSQGQYQKEQTPFFDDMRKKFGQKQKLESQTSPARQSSGGTSLPDYLREKFEKKSGLPMDDVRVHYNSDKPAELGALAYTQGMDVHIGPGQEEHLEHELVHVVQQKQGIVQPTSSQSGILLNSSPNLEKDAEAGRVLASIPRIPQTYMVVQKCGGDEDVSLADCQYCKKKTEPKDQFEIECDGGCARDAMHRLNWEYSCRIQSSAFWDSEYAKDIESDFRCFASDEIKWPILVLVKKQGFSLNDGVSHVFCAEKLNDEIIIFSCNDQNFSNDYNVTYTEEPRLDKKCSHLTGQRFVLNREETNPSSVPKNCQLKYFTHDAYMKTLKKSKKSKKPQCSIV